jgi:hypothetical protein
VPGHITQKGGQRSNAECRVPGDGEVMLPAFERGQSEVATCLTGNPIPEIGEGLREVVAGEVPRKPQALMTSSRTK